MPLRHSSVEAAMVSAAVLLAEALVMKVLGSVVRLCLLCECTRTCVVAVSAEVLVTRVMSMTETLGTSNCAVAHTSAVVRVVRAKKCIWAVAGRCVEGRRNVCMNSFFQCVTVCAIEIYSGLRFLHRQYFVFGCVRACPMDRLPQDPRDHQCERDSSEFPCGLLENGEVQ
jgi:hypothetical protein